jgi:hypothetical protein
MRSVEERDTERERELVVVVLVGVAHWLEGSAGSQLTMRKDLQRWRC